VDERIIGQRSRRLRARARDKTEAFRRGLIGRTEDVVLLHGQEARHGHPVGLTGSYVEVVIADADDIADGMARVRLTGLEGDRMVGVLA
jgi:tRNA A37 methylthiotransferase MiaB